MAEENQRPLVRVVESILIWTAALAFAVAILFTLTKWLRFVPPTRPVAVGAVTVTEASKLRDYIAALLFFLVVPAGGLWLRHLGRRVIDASMRRLIPRKGSGGVSQPVTVEGSPSIEPSSLVGRGCFADAQHDSGYGDRLRIAALLAWPFLLAPFFWLTTRKEGWALVLPIALSAMGIEALILFRSKRMFRGMLEPSLRPVHALILTEASAWILFRYLATGERIAHIPTLFLEVVLVGLFLLLLWGAAMLVSLIGSWTLGREARTLIGQVALGATPLLVLPLAALSSFDMGVVALVVLSLSLVLVFLLLRHPREISATTVRRVLVAFVIPLFLFIASYAASAAQSQWIDLFHRGESLGPASDYLRGKVPYRDVFVLHGMLDDGLLDAWLMEIFGRDVSVSTARLVVLGSLATPALWFVGMALFDSIPLALLTVLAGLVTFVDNQRILFEIVVVALLLAALKKGSRFLLLLAGAVTSVALFFSLEIGFYSLIASLGVLVLRAGLQVAEHSNVRPGLPVTPASPPDTGMSGHLGEIVAFIMGVILGATPFLIYLFSHEALGAFFTTSLATVTIIDAVWSLPFPDLGSQFRNDLSLRSFYDFVLTERIRFILNPLVIAIALTCVIYRLVATSRRIRPSPLAPPRVAQASRLPFQEQGGQDGRATRMGEGDWSLVTLTFFALITQRSALGRADFPHQYFSAFLIGPLVLLLLTLAARRLRQLARSDSHPATGILAISLVALGVPLLATVLWVPDLLNSRLDDTVRYRQRVTRSLVDDPRGAVLVDRIEAVSREITRLVGPSEPIFDFSNQPAFYFFANRPNPTRFYQVPVMSPRRFELETIRDLFATKPKVVLMRSPDGYDSFDGIDNALRAPAVSAYLNDRYEIYKNVRGVEIWKPKVDPTPLDLAHYNRQIRMPKPEESFGASRDRLVLPSISRFRGISGTWHSDLTIHNPEREEMPVRLRYVSSEGTVDRQVVLRPGETRVWKDAVESLFNLDQSIGSVIIELAARRRPVIRSRTYDDSRPSKVSGSVSVPIALTEAAGAGRAYSRLVFAGFPACGPYDSRPKAGGTPALHDGCRLDLGIVSVADVPTRFRIEARGMDGRPIGKAILDGVYEGQLYLVTDAAKRLGVTLTESSSIEVRMLDGAAVGYLTSLNPATGDAELIPALATGKR